MTAQANLLHFGRHARIATEVFLKDIGQGLLVVSHNTLALVGLTVVAVLAPFVLFKSATFSTRWNQSVSQLLNFGAGIMVMVLWTSLVTSKLSTPLTRVWFGLTALRSPVLTCC